jgi:membrane-associated phospholipid phosphatase
LWALAGVVVLGVAIELWVRGADDLHDVGDDVLAWFEELRTPVLTDVMEVIALLTTFGAVQLLRVALAAALVVTKRLRHLVVALATFVVSDWLVLTFLDVQRIPADVTPLIDATDFRFPSWPMTAFAITVFTMPLVLAPAGRPRRRAMTAAWIVVGLVAIARLYLGADYPSNVAYAALLSWVLTETTFRWFAPDEAFPIAYRRGGNAAHLDLGGPRADAIRLAMADQVGLDVTEVEPFGLEGSGGSSPLRMTLADGSRVFGKIYATSHVRADRWYRIGRTILYGKLEDETPFGSVRRLAEYEDYALR